MGGQKEARHVEREATRSMRLRREARSIIGKDLARA
jgi:hypothetical protein